MDDLWAGWNTQQKPSGRWEFLIRSPGLLGVRTHHDTYVLIHVRDATILGIRERPLSRLSATVVADDVERLWAHHGAEFVHHVQGVWAWAIAQPDRLLVFRDRLGVLPMGYARAQDGGWVVSSDLETLSDGPRLVHRGRVLQLLVGALDPLDPSDFIEGQARLAPGHCVVFR